MSAPALPADVTPYLALVTSEHQGATNLLAMTGATVQPFADEQAVLDVLPSLFDLDAAVGVQLDVVGLWVGINRYVATYTLTDDQYRTILRARIARNHWDGSIPGAYKVWDSAFAASGYSIFIIDYQDMSMDLGLFGSVPDAVTLALVTGDYLSLRPAGVRLRGLYYPTVAGPAFSWDTETSIQKGWDEGVWLAYEPLG